MLLTKDYRASMDIVMAYKSLKQAVAKAGNKDPYRHSMGEGGQNKGYLKMTIAAHQHSKKPMNQELLVYQLTSSKNIHAFHFFN